MSQMEHDSLVKLKSILSDVCGIDPDKVCLESRLVDDLGVDSLGMLECIIEFEEQFGVTVDASEVPPSVTILDILRLVES